jgi:hypothetical protein
MMHHTVDQCQTRGKPQKLLSQSDRDKFPVSHDAFVLDRLFIHFKMAVSWLVRVLLLICSFFQYLADDSQRVNRFEYKFSFKGPHLVNKNGQVPFWTVGGSKYICTIVLLLFYLNVYVPLSFVHVVFPLIELRFFIIGAIPSDDQVRITPSLRDKRGTYPRYISNVVICKQLLT